MKTLYLLLATALVLGGCAVKSLPISTALEARLRNRAVSQEEFGARTTENGLEFQLFTAEASDGPVTVPLEFALADLPAVNVRLNDTRPLKMVLDTGAQMSVIEATRADASGAKIFLSEKRPFRVVGVGGEELAWLAKFGRATIGDVVLHDFIAVLRRSRSSVSVGGVPMGGMDVNLLGAPVLAGFRYVTVDYPGREVEFSQTTPFRPRRYAARVPLTVRDNLFYVPVRVGSRTVEAMVDTGAKDQIFLNSDIVKEWGMSAQAEAGSTYRAAGIGGEVKGRQFTVPLAFVGEVPVRNVTVDTAPGLWRARIGSVLLERWRVTFDFSTRSMWLER